MQINVTLTAGDLLTIAVSKGRTETISVSQVIKGVTEIVEIDNPLTPEEFVKKVYEQYIIDDATAILTVDRTQSLKAQITTVQETTRQEVEAGVRD